MERARIAAEALDRVVVALRHDLDRGENDQNKQDEERKDEDVEAEHWHPSRRCLPEGVLLDRVLVHFSLLAMFPATDK